MLSKCHGFIHPLNLQTSSTQLNSKFCDHDESSQDDRRAFISKLVTFTSSSAMLLSSASPALAGIDPSALQSFSVEGDASGSTTRLRQIEADRNRPSDLVNQPYEELSSGVSYREYREGKGDAVVAPGSKVVVEMTIRCKSFATANEPGGVKYFNTKGDTDFNELAFTIGGGEISSGLEEGMMGMRKGALRRIEVPSTMVFAARNANQLPLPKDTNKDEKRVFDRLFKTDATLLFEVLVTRIK